MTTVVLGANGLLGSNVFTTVSDRGGHLVGTYHSTNPSFDSPCHQLDIRETDRIAMLLDETDPDLVVNCAAMTDVDGCEENPDQARAVNGDSPGTIARLCDDRDIAFTHVSTDYVFDGEGDTPYNIGDSPNPIQKYGESKLAGERAVRKQHPEPTIVRLSFVYGIHRGTDELEGFPAWVRDRLQSGGRTPLFTDQWVTPTRAGRAAETILDLHEKGASGLYHVACRSCVTPYEFGQQIRERMSVSAEYVEEGSMDDVDRPAERPSFSCLDVSSTESALDRRQPTLIEDLDAIEAIFQ